MAEITENLPDPNQPVPPPELYCLPDFKAQFKPQEKAYIDLHSIDLMKIFHRQSTPEYTKMLAVGLTQQQYISTGAWFGNLSNESIKQLYGIAEQIETKDFKQYLSTTASKASKEQHQENLQGLVLICLLLSLASGKDRLQHQELAHAMQALQSIILTEYLNRFKQTVELYRQNYTLEPCKLMIAISKRR